MDHQPRHAPATLRNRDAILSIMKTLVPNRGLLLEIASGTGEHAAHMAPRLPPALIWQPTDAAPDALADIDAHTAGCESVRPALLLDTRMPNWPVPRSDIILCCNMIHIAPWDAGVGLFAGAARILPAGGALVLYGPFRRHGAHTAPSNAEFDRSLRARDASWGVRCLDSEVRPAAAAVGLELDGEHSMPANNLTIVLRRT